MNKIIYVSLFVSLTFLGCSQPQYPNLKIRLDEFLKEQGITNEICLLGENFLVVGKKPRGYCDFSVKIDVKNGLKLNEIINKIVEKAQEEIKRTNVSSGLTVEILSLKNDKNIVFIKFDKDIGAIKLTLPESWQFDENINGFNGIYSKKRNSPQEILLIYKNNSGYIIGKNWENRCHSK